MRSTARAVTAKAVTVLAATASAVLLTALPGTAAADTSSRPNTARTTGTATADTASAASTAAQVSCYTGPLSTRAFLDYVMVFAADGPTCFTGTGTIDVDIPHTEDVHIGIELSSPTTITYDYNGSSHTATLSPIGSFEFLNTGETVYYRDIGTRSTVNVTLRSLTLG